MAMFEGQWENDERRGECTSFIQPSSSHEGGSEYLKDIVDEHRQRDDAIRRRKCLCAFTFIICALSLIYMRPTQVGDWMDGKMCGIVP